jgi:hypothetical protein
MKAFSGLLLFTLTLIFFAMKTQPTEQMLVHPLRLRPGQDLMQEIRKYTEEHEIKAAAVLTCVGSLTDVTLRLANQHELSTYEGHFEIVSLVGTLGTEGIHLHMSVSDSSGQTIGGHLVEGCKVYTTAELVLAELPAYRFAREMDEESGYKELKIYRRE